MMERAELRRLERDLGVLEVEEQKINAEEQALGVVAKSVPKRKVTKKKTTKRRT